MTGLAFAYPRGPLKRPFTGQRSASLGLREERYSPLSTFLRRRPSWKAVSWAHLGGGGLPSASPTILPATVTVENVTVENDFAPDTGTLRPETLLILLTVHRY